MYGRRTPPNNTLTTHPLPPLDPPWPLTTRESPFQASGFARPLWVCGSRTGQNITLNSRRVAMCCVGPWGWIPVGIPRWEFTGGSCWVSALLLENLPILPRPNLAPSPSKCSYVSEGRPVRDTLRLVPGASAASTNYPSHFSSFRGVQDLLRAKLVLQPWALRALWPWRMVESD